MKPRIRCYWMKAGAVWSGPSLFTIPSAAFGCITIIEPPRDKTNKVSVRPAKTQISLGIRPVWSESSLSAWRKLGPLVTHWAYSEDSDQTGQMPRLIWVFDGRTAILLVLSWGGWYGKTILIQNHFFRIFTIYMQNGYTKVQHIIYHLNVLLRYCTNILASLLRSTGCIFVYVINCLLCLCNSASVNVRVRVIWNLIKENFFKYWWSKLRDPKIIKIKTVFSEENCPHNQAHFYSLDTVVILKMGSRSPKSNVFNYPNDTLHEVWCESIIWFKIQGADYLFWSKFDIQSAGVTSFSAGVTLKTRSRSPKLNHFFPLS